MPIDSSSLLKYVVLVSIVWLLSSSLPMLTILAFFIGPYLFPKSFIKKLGRIRPQAFDMLRRGAALKAATLPSYQIKFDRVLTIQYYDVYQSCEHSFFAL